MVAPRSSPELLLALRGIRKAYGSVEVLKGIDFELRAGEVHALCGENGAGKSTLVSIVAGVTRPDHGKIELMGRSFPAFASANAAQKAGIGMVFQERSLFDPLTAAENIFAGRQPVNAFGMIDRRKLALEATRWLSAVAPGVSANDRVGELSPARQQMVEIAKALSLRARIFIFDEPTAALTRVETSLLFGLIRRLRANGAGIIYITHRLEEVFELADRVTVLKDGVWQGTCHISETNHDDLIRRMVGRDLEAGGAVPDCSNSTVVLEVDDLHDSDPRGAGLRLRGVSLRVRAGEIVGLAGLAGAGRTETALALFGARPGARGEIRINGARCAIHRPGEAVASGLGYLSEDRKENGLFLDMSVRANISAARLDRFGHWSYRDQEETAVAENFRRSLNLVCRDLNQKVVQLSGGNQQKVLLARWLLVDPRVLIVDEPTRGLDVGARVEVHRLLREFAARGRGVLMISSDLPEVLAVSHRVYVMRAGTIAGELAMSEATEESVMRLAAGAGAR